MRVNLLPLEERPTPARIVRTVWLSGAIALLLLVVSLALVAHQSLVLMQTENEYKESQQETRLLEIQRQQVEELEATAGELEQRLDTYCEIMELGEVSVNLGVVPQIYNQVPPGMWLEAMTISLGGAEIKGYSERAEVVEQLKLAADRLGFSPELIQLRHPFNSPLSAYVIWLGRDR